LCLHDSWRPQGERRNNDGCRKDAHGHSFSSLKNRKILSTKFGKRLIFMWRFIETNAAAMGTLDDCAVPPLSVVI
jgi:hypothetical protein